MSIVTKKLRWTKKPNQPVRIDWSNPLSKSLELCFLLNETGGSGARDSAKSHNSSYIGTPTPEVGTEGRALKFSNATDAVDITTLTLTASQNKTFTFLIKPNSLINSDFIFDTATGRLVLALQDTGSIDTISFYDGAWKETNVAADLGVYQVLIFSFEGTTARVYKDSVQIGGDIAYTQRAIGDRTRLGNDSQTTPSHPSDSSIAFFAIHSRALNSAEVKSFSNNLYQILKPRTQYISLADAAPAGGRIMSSLTANGGLAGHGGIAGIGGGLAG